jgi:hypothetical protein
VCGVDVGATVVDVNGDVVRVYGKREKQPIIERTMPRAGRSSIVLKIVNCTVETNIGLFTVVIGIFIFKSG